MADSDNKTCPVCKKPLKVKPQIEKTPSSEIVYGGPSKRMNFLSYECMSCHVLLGKGIFSGDKEADKYLISSFEWND